MKENHLSLLWISILGLSILFFLSRIYFPIKDHQELYLFLFAGLIDRGHVYLTFFRVFESQRGFSEKFRKVTLFFSILGAIFILSQYEILRKLLFQFFYYFTIYHHILQAKGVFLWIYDKKRAHYFARVWIFSVLLDLLLLHIRQDADSIRQRFYLLDFGVSLNVDGFLWFTLPFFPLILVLKSIFSDLRCKVFLMSHAFFLFTIFLHFYCLVISQEFESTLYPLLGYHGVSYVFFVFKAKQMSNPTPYDSIYIIGTLLIAGIFEFELVELALSRGQVDQKSGIYAFGLSMLMGPSFWHYIVDSSIWKKSDQVARALRRKFEQNHL